MKTKKRSLFFKYLVISLRNFLIFFFFKLRKIKKKKNKKFDTFFLTF